MPANSPQPIASPWGYFFLVPVNWYVPSGWRDRLFEVQERVRDPDDELSRGVDRLRKLLDNPAGYAETFEEVLARHSKDLLPGEAGRETLAAIVNGREINPLRNGGHLLSGPVDIFQTPVEPYTAAVMRPRGKNRYGSRRSRTEPRDRRMLDLLQGTPQELPTTPGGAQLRLGMNADRFRDRRKELAALGIRTPTSAEQKNRLKKHGIGIKDELEYVPWPFLIYRTGLSVSALRQLGARPVKPRGGVREIDTVFALEVPKYLLWRDEPAPGSDHYRAYFEDRELRLNPTDDEKQWVRNVLAKRQSQ